MRADSPNQTANRSSPIRFRKASQTSRERPTGSRCPSWATRSAAFGMAPSKSQLPTLFRMAAGFPSCGRVQSAAHSSHERGEGRRSRREYRGACSAVKPCHRSAKKTAMRQRRPPRGGRRRGPSTMPRGARKRRADCGEQLVRSGPRRRKKPKTVTPLGRDRRVSQWRSGIAYTAGRFEAARQKACGHHTAVSRARDARKSSTRHDRLFGW